jgi:hypothetical protein
MQEKASHSLGESGEDFFLDIPSHRTSPLIGLIEFSGYALGVVIDEPMPNFVDVIMCNRQRSFRSPTRFESLG